MQLPTELRQEHNIFSGLDALSIDLANNYGLDKETWEDRLLWTELHWHELDDMVNKAESPILYRKSLHAYRLANKGMSIGHNMFLDACNSGAQIYAILTGCKTTAANCGLIDNDNVRKDAYTAIHHDMERSLGKLEYSREDGKNACMKGLYNSKAVPIEIYGEGTPELAAFYRAMHKELPGAMVALNTINKFWDDTALYHQWTLPNGHTARILVTDTRTTRIEVDELDHVTFSYRFESNECSSNFRPLAPRIIHSVDAYITQVMGDKAKELGFELAHIFDAFCFHPNYCSTVMRLYRETLAEIADSDLLSDILSEISGKAIKLNKFSNDLSADILKSKYALS